MVHTETDIGGSMCKLVLVLPTCLSLCSGLSRTRSLSEVHGGEFNQVTRTSIT